MATLQNIFAGCNVRGLCTKADNFQVVLYDSSLQHNCVLSLMYKTAQL